MPDKFVQDVKEKLEILRTKDTDLDILGSETHEYRLNKIHKEKEVAKFEKNIIVLSRNHTEIF